MSEKKRGAVKKRSKENIKKGIHYIKVVIPDVEFEAIEKYLESDPFINTKNNLIRTAVKEYIIRKEHPKQYEIKAGGVDSRFKQDVRDSYRKLGLKLDSIINTVKNGLNNQAPMRNFKRISITLKDCLEATGKPMRLGDIMKKTNLSDKDITNLLGLYPDKFILNLNTGKIGLGDKSVKKQ